MNNISPSNSQLNSEFFKTNINLTQNEDKKELILFEQDQDNENKIAYYMDENCLEIITIGLSKECTISINSHDEVGEIQAKISVKTNPDNKEFALKNISHKGGTYLMIAKTQIKENDVILIGRTEITIKTVNTQNYQLIVQFDGLEQIINLPQNQSSFYKLQLQDPSIHSGCIQFSELDRQIFVSSLHLQDLLWLKINSSYELKDNDHIKFTKGTYHYKVHINQVLKLQNCRKCSGEKNINYYLGTCRHRYCSECAKQIDFCSCGQIDTGKNEWYELQFIQNENFMFIAEKRAEDKIINFQDYELKT